MSFEKPPTVEKPKSEQEKEKGELLFEIKRKIKDMSVSIGIERGQEPARGVIDFENKKVEARITPDGIKRALNTLGEFLEKPGTKETLRSWTEKIHSYREKLKAQREKERDKETVKSYVEQEGRPEAEVIEELLDEIKKESGSE